jgi:DegV family protein with EDD domain
MAYIVTTDSCSDLSTEYMKKRDLPIIPLMFTIDGKDYYDDKSMSSEEFFGMVRSGKMSKTSLINAARFEEFFEGFIKRGLDIIHISLSSELSGSHQNAIIAMDTLKAKYPNSKLTAIDSRTVSLGVGLLVHLGLNKRDEGATYDELVEYLGDLMPRVCAWFTVDDLNHLYRGGRLSKTSSVIGSILSVKPILRVNDDGKLVPEFKVKGRKKSIKRLVDEMEKTAINPRNNTVFIAHGDCPEEAEQLAELVQERFGTKDIYCDSIGPVIGTHGGPGTLGVIFIGYKR